MLLGFFPFFLNMFSVMGGAGGGTVAISYIPHRMLILTLICIKVFQTSLTFGYTKNKFRPVL